MNSPSDEGSIDAPSLDDAIARDLGPEAPPHPDDDRSALSAALIDDDVRPSATEPEGTEEPAAPPVVPDVEDEPFVDEATVPERRIPATWLIALATLVTAGRFWFSSNRTMIHIAIDEPAQLAMARWLAGGTRWNLFDHSTWRPGMATLLAPLYWFTDDTTTLVRGGLLIGAALGGVGAVLLARIAHRITTMPPVACVLAAGVVALAPSSLAATSYIWAESLVTVTFLGALLLTIDTYDSGRIGSAIGAIVVSVLGFVAHGRLLPFVALVAVVVVGRFAARREWRPAGVLAVVAIGWTVMAHTYTAWIFSHVWDDPGNSNTVGSITTRLPRITDNAQSLVGQTWYQFVATAGLAAAAVGVAIAAGFRRGSAKPVLTARNARIVLAYTLPLVAVSVIFMSGRTRADQRIYGRYNDAVMWPLIIVGIAWLLSLRHAVRPARLAAGVAVIVGLTAAGTYAVDRWHGGEFAESVGVRPMVAGFAPVIGTTNAIPAIEVAVYGMALFVGLVVIALLPRRGVLLAVVAVAFLVVGGVRTHDGLNTRLNSWQPTTEVAAIEDIVPPDEVLGVKFVRDADDPKVKWDDQRRRIQLYQFSLPDRLVVRDRGVDDGIGPFVFAPVGDPELVAAGAKVVWKDPRIMYALWEEPVSPRDRPAP